jgi:hypothetical protein
MMLNKTMVWIFSIKTLKAMRDDRNFHFAEIKDDPSPPSYLTLAHQLADLGQSVLAEKEGEKEAA